MRHMRRQRSHATVRAVGKRDTAKLVWLGVSIPVVTIAELEGAVAAGVLITIAGWAISHWIAVRG